MSINDNTPAVELSDAEEQRYLEVFEQLAVQQDLTAHNLDSITDAAGEDRWRIGTITPSKKITHVEVFDMLDGTSDFASITLASQVERIIGQVHAWHPQLDPAGIVPVLNPNVHVPSTA